MPISPYKVWIAGEVLTAADLNASFTQVFSNGQSLGFPRTEAADFNGFELVVDEDGDSSITADTDDLMDFRLQGADLVKFDGTTASAVNGFTLAGGAAGSPARLATQGGDANINLLLDPKGTGSVDLDGAALIVDQDADSSLRETADDIVALRLRGQDLVIFDGATGGTTVNGVTVQASATGAGVQIKAQGSDTNIDLLLDPKGTGVVDLDGATFTIDADADSTLRATADDVVALRLQGLDSVIFDGDAASPVNGFALTTSATTVDPSLSTQGSDTNINLRLSPKGSGVIASANGYAVDGTTALTWRLIGSGTSLLVQENTGTPTSPTWTTRNTFATATGLTASGAVLLNTYTSSNVASLDIVSQIISAYRFYMVLFSFVPVTDDVELWIRTDANNGASFDAGATDYDFATRFDGPGLTDTNISTVSGTTQMSLSENSAGNAVSNVGIEGISGRLFIYPAANAMLWWDGVYIEATDDTSVHFYGGGRRSSASDINAIRFLFESGNISVMDVSIYGFTR